MATNIKYLDLTGLGKYNVKIQGWVLDKIDAKIAANNTAKHEEINKGVSAYNAWVKFLEGAEGSTLNMNQISTKLSDITGDIAGLENSKADKATTLAGYGITDAYTTSQADGKIATEIGKVKTTVSKDGTLVSLTTAGTGANMTISVDESALNTALDGKANKATTLAGYNIGDAYTKTEVNTELDKKANKATTLSGYGITDAYTKTEVDNTVSGINKNIEDILNAIEGGTHFIGVKTELPGTANNSDIVIVGNKEYIYDSANTGNKWIELGDTTEEGNRISAIEKVLGNDTTTTIATRITNAINALVVEGNDTTPTTDYDVKAISQISQTDGKISVDAYVNIGSITEAEINGLNWA